MIFESCRHLPLNFQVLERLYDVTLCCLCVPSAEQDGLAPSLTHPSENTNWQQGSLRERQRGRDLRSNSIIEIVFHLNIEIPRAIIFHLPLLFSLSLFVTFPLFASFFLEGELTDLQWRLGQTEKHLVRNEGGRRERRRKEKENSCYIPPE